MLVSILFLRFDSIHVGECVNREFALRAHTHTHRQFCAIADARAHAFGSSAGAGCLCGEYIPFGSFCLCSSAFFLLQLCIPPLFVHSVPRIRSLLTEFRRGSVLIFKHFFLLFSVCFFALLSLLFTKTYRSQASSRALILLFSFVCFAGSFFGFDSLFFPSFLLSRFSFSFAFIYVRFISLFFVSFFLF